MFLSEATKKILENVIGKSVEELSAMTFDEEIAYATQKHGAPPSFSKNVDNRMVSRGNPLIIRKRLCTMEDIDRRIKELP